ncbi:MAG: SRPBCC family protein, partial [Nitrososphaeraceae archaeon]|nr:SRPBCC family protein [Nitrososphaeraceae archaeon]
MKIFKNILLTIAAALVILLIAALFMNKDYGVEREVVILESKDTVFAYIKNLKNQDDFSSWSSKDPNMIKEYVGEDGQVGFISKWDSEDPDVGRGEQEIVSVEEGKRIDYELRFYEPFESTEKAYMIVEAIDDTSTKVIWGFKGRFDYPQNLFLLFVDFEEAIGND